MRCRGEELVEWADRALELAGGDSPAAIEAAAIHGLGLSMSGHPVEASVAYDASCASVRHGAQAQRVTLGRGWLHLSQDDVDGARSTLEGAVAVAGLGGSVRISLWALGWLARVQFPTGEWDRALHSGAGPRARRVERYRAGHAVAGVDRRPGARAPRRLGEAAGAVRATDVVTRDYEMMQIPTLLARAQIAKAEADYAKVRRVLDPLTRMGSGGALHEPGLWPWADVLANAVVIDGQLAAADTFFAREDRARTRGHRSTMARLGSARGRLSGAMGSSAPRAILSFAWRAHLCPAVRPRAQGRRPAPDARAAEGRAHPAGGGGDRAGGAGLSNRKVADELYVSPKTVPYHLTRIYAKLGVRSRAELAGVRR